MLVQVAVQELSDRGRGWKERKVGADLYISIVVEDEQGNARSIEMGPCGRAISLREQSEEMLRRSKESYVWIYDLHGVSVVPVRHSATCSRTVSLARRATP
jgi:hypothetical protein